MVYHNFDHPVTHHEQALAVSDIAKFSAVEEYQQYQYGIYNMVDTQQKVLMQWMDSSATAFSEKLQGLGPIRFDNASMVDIGGYKLPTWYIGNQKITGDNTLVDILISKQKLPATLFQLHDNKFIRVSSNVRQPDGNRIVGTIVDSGPIYEKIINGQQVWRGRGSGGASCTG